MLRANFRGAFGLTGTDTVLYLLQSASPHQRRAADGRLIEIETQNTIRARELRDLYNSISLTTVSQEQRLHFLMTLKHTVKVKHTQFFHS